MRLISLTEFVLNQETWFDKPSPDYPYKADLDNYYKIVKYAIFLKQPLKLEMFIPCDDEGNILKEPSMYFSVDALKMLDEEELSIALDFNEKATEYREAKEKVLFKINNVKRFVQVRKNKILIEYNRDSSISFEKATIEDLVNWHKKVQLTDNAIKQL